jgi:hypothetical protein
MSPLFTGLSCIPTVDPSIGNCTQGTYPEYVVNARSVRDVQAAVNFARNTNIRLVIKNTGHDFAGKASGKGSLSIRTHMLKDIQFVEEYVSRGYTGPAFRVGSGVQTREIYAAAHQRGHLVVGGEGQVDLSFYLFLNMSLHLTRRIRLLVMQAATFKEAVTPL